MTVDINLIDSICTDCKECVKETTLTNLEINSRVSLFCNNVLTIKSIYENYITISLECDCNCIIVRNIPLLATIPICCNCQKIKIKVQKITQ